MDWPAATPYAIATVAFAQWPALWLVVAVVAACSVHRGPASLACGVAMIVVLAVLHEAGVVRPPLEPANYGRVVFAAAVLAPLLVLPRALWPIPGRPAPIEPTAPVRRGVLWLLAVLLLQLAAFAMDRGYLWLDPEPTDARLSAWIVCILLSTVLMARWTATGAWLVSSSAFADRPRLRRALAALAVTGLIALLHGEPFLPMALSAAGDFAPAEAGDQNPGESCATVTALPAQQVLHLEGRLCADTVQAFEAAHRAHPEIRRIVLDSGGGLSHAALEIGRRLEELGFDARVDRRCGSACVTVLVGAHRRQVGAEGWIGIHRASISVWAEGNRRVRWPMPDSEEVVAFLESRGVARALEHRANETPPDDVDILSDQDLVAYGIAEPTNDAPWLPAATLRTASASPAGEPR